MSRFVICKINDSARACGTLVQINMGQKITLNLGVTHKYKNQKKSEISDFSGPPPPPPPPPYGKVRTQNQKSFIAFLDTMSYDWDFKIILYFSPLKSGKDLEYF